MLIELPLSMDCSVSLQSILISAASTDRIEERDREIASKEKLLRKNPPSFVDILVNIQANDSTSIFRTCLLPISLRPGLGLLENADFSKTFMWVAAFLFKILLMFSAAVASTLAINSRKNLIFSATTENFLLKELAVMTLVKWPRSTRMNTAGNR